MSSISSPCKHCKDVFMRPGTLDLLSSERGLEYHRDEYSMISTALNGCLLCRELLCMPWNKGRMYAPNERTWPIEKWEKRKDACQSNLQPSAGSDTFLPFWWKGDPRTEHFVWVAQGVDGFDNGTESWNPKGLRFEISAAFGRQYLFLIVNYNILFFYQTKHHKFSS